jgi:hypothetical protein
VKEPLETRVLRYEGCVMEVVKEVRRAVCIWLSRVSSERGLWKFQPAVQVVEFSEWVTIVCQQGRSSLMFASWSHCIKPSMFMFCRSDFHVRMDPKLGCVERLAAVVSSFYFSWLNWMRNLADRWIKRITKSGRQLRKLRYVELTWDYFVKT